MRVARRTSRLAAYALIAAVAAALGGGFAWTRGWIGPERTTAQRIVDAIEANGYRQGARRAHGKGVCAFGRFESSGRGATLSRAAVFAPGAVTPFVGRFSVGGPPWQADGGARVRSLALSLATPDGQVWRTAMNSFPVLSVGTPDAFLAQTLAARPDPSTGKPDPARQAAFAAAHPETAAFRAWAASAPWPSSFANTAYHGVNAFRFLDADDRVRHVRWTLEPQAPLVELDAAQRAAADRDFLAAELAARVREGPQRWTLRITVAAPEDPVHDPTRAWPAGRETHDAGTVVVERIEPQDDGACRDVNFDPLILPDGIAASDDPMLAARSAAYAESFNRRLREFAGGRSGDVR